MTIGVSDSQVFGELGVRAEMPGIGSPDLVFWRPFAIRVASITTDTATGN